MHELHVSIWHRSHTAGGDYVRARAPQSRLKIIRLPGAGNLLRGTGFRRVSQFATSSKQLRVTVAKDYPLVGVGYWRLLMVKLVGDFITITDLIKTIPQDRGLLILTTFPTNSFHCLFLLFGI